MFNAIRELLNSDDLPNKFSTAIGELIRSAREEKGMSQGELAEAIYKRRTSISDIEKGKMYPDIVSMMLISNFLQKPLSYFIPSNFRGFPEYSEITEEEEELLFHFRRIQQPEQRKIAIAQVRTMADISNPKSIAG